jgi:predicted DNA-binding transcriptional regulator AlpA
MTSKSLVPRHLRYKELEELGVVKSYAGLRHLKIHDNFPLGKLLGPSTRVWTETEVADWLASRPTEQSEQTKKRAAKSVVVKQARRNKVPAIKQAPHTNAAEQAEPTVVDEAAA